MQSFIFILIGVAASTASCLLSRPEELDLSNTFSSIFPDFLQKLVVSGSPDLTISTRKKENYFKRNRMDRMTSRYHFFLSSFSPNLKILDQYLAARSGYNCSSNSAV